MASTYGCRATARSALAGLFRAVASTRNVVRVIEQRRDRRIRILRSTSRRKIPCQMLLKRRPIMNVQFTRYFKICIRALPSRAPFLLFLIPDVTCDPEHSTTNRSIESALLPFVLDVMHWHLLRVPYTAHRTREHSVCSGCCSLV
jgi:hypothetical protein